LIARAAGLVPAAQRSLHERTSRNGVSPTAPEHVPELDGVRGLAILLVLVWHYVIDQSRGSLVARAGALTWSGVDLFFVLSGFLLGSILIRHRGGERFYAAFYARRACRILPLYAVLLVLYVLADAWLKDPANQGHAWLFGRPMPFWTYATLTQNVAMSVADTSGAHFLGITWSLAVEEQFYLILPLIIAFAPPRLLPWLLAALIGLAPVLRALAEAQRLDAFVLMPTRMDSLLGGVLLACLLNDPSTRAWFEARTRFLKWLLAIFGLGFAILTLERRSLGVLDHTWLAALYTVLVAIVVVDRSGPISRSLRARWLVGLGVVSYGVYLFHQAVSGLLHGTVFQRPPHIDSIASAALTTLALGLTIAIAVATRTFIEAPILGMGRRIAYRASG
jgi:peptidoglycan/LPS O-acetylase OafA/YrhL